MNRPYILGNMIKGKAVSNSKNHWFKRFAWVNLILIITLLAGFFEGSIFGLDFVSSVSAHNLQTRMVSMFMDAETQAMLDARMADPGWMPPDPLLQVGDELGLIIKVVPRDGTTTGVGGHIDFYVPNGVEVIDVGYLVPDGLGGFEKVPMKGQSPIAIGDGSVGAKTTSELVGLSDVYTSTASGISSTTVNPTDGLHYGTIAGVYGDTGIFYSTDPDTAYGSWQNYNSASTADGCGSLAFNPDADGPTLVNNSGDTVVPCNKWDAEQLMAWGVKGGTFPAYDSPIVDYGDGRGNAPWGFASSVAGPQSGYAWNFNWDEWDASAKDPAAMQAAMGTDEIGPWQRIQYDGDRISFDTPGLDSTVLGYASKDAGDLGVDVSAIPATTSQTDATSPKVIRWAVGQLTQYRPEYAWVKIKVNDIAEIIDPSGCPVFYGDTFGGDAGGTDNGKDHLWRYYEPTEVTWNGCLAAQKNATREIVKVGDTYQYKLKIYNFQNFTLSNVVVRDTLPSAVTFVGAVPAQTSGPNPLVWNVGTLLPGQKWEATVTVIAKSTGPIDNCMEITSSELDTQTVCDSTTSGSYPFLVPTKFVTPTGVAPGGTVIYEVSVRNTGTGPTGSPVTIREYLPEGFTYDSSYTPIVHINGVLVTPTVNATIPGEPVFTIPLALQAGKTLTISFRALVSPAIEPGEYCNTYSITQNGVPITTGSLACVDVAGGKIGDTIWRDWDGDGIQDPAEEGISGVTVKLFASDGTTLLATTTTDANGIYYFTGVQEGTYVVKVNDGTTLSGYTQTYDPDSTVDNQHTVILAENQQYLTADFGYQPVGTAEIGDTVFEDIGNDGVYNSGLDVGIPNVTVYLYEDSNGDGIIDPDLDQLIDTTETDLNGIYSFSGLAEGFDYLVKVDSTDPDIQTYFDNAYDPDPAYQLTTPEVSSSLDLSGSDLDNDFGFWRVMPASIGDQVFIDNDFDNIFSTGDTPLGGITVDLYRDGVWIATTTTTPDGHYLFTGLGPGDYSVIVDTSDPDLPGGLFATITQFDETLTPGEEYLLADFPFTKALSKSVIPDYATEGQTITYTLKPYYPGSDLLSNVRVVDPIPAGTTYVSSSANAGGVYGAYTPIAAVPGQDTIGSLTLDTSFTVNTNFVLAGASVTVTMNVKQNSGSTVNNVSPTELTVIGGEGVCSGPIPTEANVPTGTTGSNFIWICTLSDVGEYTFAGAAMDATESYTWPDATSASVFSSPGGGTNMVTWSLGDNVAGTPGETIISGYTSGIYAFMGANKKEFSKYSISGNNWTSKAQTTNGIEKGGSLTTDGNGIIYALEGNSKIFYKYTIATDTWTTLPNTSDNANEGGGVQYLEVSGVKYVYALLGNSKRFRRYDISSNTWASLADTPENIKKGGALTTDGTYLYALRGDLKKDFYRYDIATNTWSSMASLPVNVGWGGSLTRMGNDIYAMQGDGKKGFYRYDITANTWTAMASTPANVGDGGSLTNNGIYIYALQGKTKVFWRYDPTKNTWATMAPVNFTGNVGQGGALVFEPGQTPVGYFTSLLATPNLVSDGDQIKVKFTIESSNPVNDVTPGTLIITPTNSASAVCTGPVLITADDDILSIDDPVIYQWTCTATPGTLPGTLQFSNNATGSGSVTFPTASSKTILVSPILSYQVTVDAGAPAVIENTGVLLATSGFGSIPSNTVETATSGSIGDRVWADLDGDGIQDGNELGLAGVKVYIDSNDNGVWDSGEPYDITDSNGLYKLNDLDAGTYNVNTDPATYPSGYLPTTSPSLSVTLASGEQYEDADFGLQPPAEGQIGDTVWLDKDNDGILDTGESGIPGITIILEKCFGSICIPVATTITDADGFYTFDGLIKGDYRVSVDTTSLVTSPYGGDFTLASAMDPTYDKDGITTPDVTYPVTLATDTSTLDDVDFGYNWSGSIGDYVWWDDNRDGIQDALEDPVASAAVMLYVDSNQNGILDEIEGDYQIAYMLTDSDGLYLFENLPPGNYLVDVYEDSLTTDGVRDVIPTTPNVQIVDLDPGESHLTADFGYYEGALVEGNVFHDDDRNSVFDTSETGLAGITVYLYDETGTVLIDTTTTDADGHFVFIVVEGDYTLTYATSETTSAGYPEATTDTSITFHAYPGEDWHPSFDFGVDYAGTIGDWVWNDADGQGDFDVGELGIGGVTLNLYASDGTTWLGATVTDEDGYYLFEGLQDGTYLVEVDTSTLPATFTNTYDEDNGTTSPDDQTYVTITGGNTHLSADFAYYNDVSFPISGNVFEDINSIGVKDETGTGLSGITVNLYDASGTTLLATTTTDVNGDYTFPGMPNGSYLVKVDLTTLPTTAYIETYEEDGSINNAISVTVLNAPAVDNDFGFHQYPGSISGYVCDGSGNGLCDAGEPPLPGVTVTLTSAGPDGLLGTADDVQVSTTTAVDGSYSFTNLPPGTYFVDELNPEGYLSLADRDGGNPDSILVVLGLGEDKIHQDFEDYFPSGTIGDWIWLDEDGDGDQDAGEAGIPNILVELCSDASCTTVLDTTYTDSNGGYLFTGLSDATYYVRTTPPTGLNPTYDEDGIGTPDLSIVTITAGDDHLTADFGYNWSTPPETNTNTGTGAIGDRVWIDADGDGVQDPSEPGMYDIPVDLYTAGPDGVFGTVDDVLVQSTTTDYNGNYIFDDLDPDAYVIVVNNGITPIGYNQTGDPDNTLDNQTTFPISLAPGDVFVNADFGYYPTEEYGASIGDYVWLDADADGVQDTGEFGIPLVTVSLIQDLNENGVWDSGEPIIATTLTDSDGYYAFTGVPVTDGVGTDDYLIWVNDTNNILGSLLPTFDSDGINTPNISAISDLSPAGDLLQDFGYTPILQKEEFGLIGDTVFLDRDGDNLFDPGEGLEGVTVRLFASDGVTLLGITQTDENGNYYFGGLPQDGTFIVKVDETSLPGSALINSVDPDGGNDSQATVTLTSSLYIRLDQDFGYIASDPNTISGTIWDDLDGDGIQEGNETNGIPGVTVTLFDEEGNSVATTVTDEDGNYSFPGLPDGNYYVDVTDEKNVLDGYWKSECPETYCGEDGYSQIDPYPVSVTGGEENTTADFGYFITPAALGNFVFNDFDHDGIQGFSEVGIPGVEVTLTITYPGVATPTVITTYTDINGEYSFDNLLLDEDYTGTGLGEPTYLLTVEIPEAYPVVSPNDAGSDDEDSDGVEGVGVVTVTVGVDPNADLQRGIFIDLFDFGFYPVPTAVVGIDGPVGEYIYGSIHITWQTRNEMEILGFNLYRSTSPIQNRILLSAMQALHIGNPMGDSYQFIDPDVELGVTYYYWLEVLYEDGSSEFVDEPAITPAGYFLFVPFAEN